METPAIAVAVDSFLLIAATNRKIELIKRTIVKVKRRKMKNAAGSRFKLAIKYREALKSVTLISFTGHIVISEEIASIPGWYMEKLACFC
jgi:hypothetical protein